MDTKKALEDTVEKLEHVCWKAFNACATLCLLIGVPLDPAF